ncbi:MAG: DUF1828 domain-containing protein [Methanomicrobiales archaeon]
MIDKKPQPFSMGDGLNIGQFNHTEFPAESMRPDRMEDDGVDRYWVFTPFPSEDGDHLVVVLKHQDGGWVLSDEGHTFVHLTYNLEDEDLRSGGRQKNISNALSALSVDDRN